MKRAVICQQVKGEGSGLGEDVMRAWSLDQLHDVAKSKQHFAVLLVRKFFTREQLQGHSVSRGKLGKVPLDKGLLEKMRGIYFVYHPSDTREEDWKRVTAINTYLRGKALKKAFIILVMSLFTFKENYLAFFRQFLSLCLKTGATCPICIV